MMEGQKANTLLHLYPLTVTAPLFLPQPPHKKLPSPLISLTETYSKSSRQHLNALPSFTSTFTALPFRQPQPPSSRSPSLNPSSSASQALTSPRKTSPLSRHSRRRNSSSKEEAAIHTQKPTLAPSTPLPLNSPSTSPSHTIPLAFSKANGTLSHQLSQLFHRPNHNHKPSLHQPKPMNRQATHSSLGRPAGLSLTDQPQGNFMHHSQPLDSLQSAEDTGHAERLRLRRECTAEGKVKGR